MEPTTTVFGIGTASAPCTSVSIEVGIKHWAASSLEARTRVGEKVKAVHAALQRLRAGGLKLPAAGLPSQLSVYAARARAVSPQAHELDGYQADYELTVESTDLERATELFDALTAIDGVTAGSPRFSIEASTAQHLKNEAFKQAVAAAKARFAFQCQVIGFDASRFKVSAWRYDGPGTDQLRSGKRTTIDDAPRAVLGRDVEVTCKVYLTYSPC